MPGTQKRKRSASFDNNGGSEQEGFSDDPLLAAVDQATKQSESYGFGDSFGFDTFENMPLSRGGEGRGGDGSGPERHETSATALASDDERLRTSEAVVVDDRVRGDGVGDGDGAGSDSESDSDEYDEDRLQPLFEKIKGPLASQPVAAPRTFHVRGLTVDDLHASAHRLRCLH